ncbi:unnamed protein product [Adineta ricciae]|uniref:G-protein coupled receptors family 1 profile domain-containing protein n=1 Tax=Adineta ricciae TaxID=249248 RepID=A0A813TZ51_ADIRI|nr:unnamed protein product [Adineta ricciae]
MSSSEQSLRFITDQMTTISLFLLLVIGPFGCFCNILTFTSKQLTKNPCAFYLLCTTIFELCIVCFGGVSRLAAEYFGDKLLSQNQFYCKLRSYLITGMSTIATYSMLFTAVDRYMATSTRVRFRAFSQITIAHRMCLGIILVVMIVTLHVYIFFGLHPSCTPRPGVYAVFYSAYLIILTSLIPDGLIIVVALCTIKNARDLRTRAVMMQAANTSKQRSIHRADTHLLIMMVSQVSISVSFDITRTTCYTYFFISGNTGHSSYQTLVNVFIFQFSNVLLYLNYSKSFYVYTLTSGLFRKIGHDRVDPISQHQLPNN